MNNRRTICIMGRVLDQEDGLGVYSINLIKHMLALDEENRYVILLRSDAHAHSFSDFPNAETHVLPAKSKAWWDQVVVPRTARKVRADLIFNPKFSIPLLTTRPTIFVLQGSDWYVNPGNYEWWDNLYIRLAMPLFCRKATKLVAISQCVVDDLVKYARLDPRKATVTYAAPSPHFRPVFDQQQLQAFADRYKLPARYIFTVARVLHTGHANLPIYPGGNVENLVRGYLWYREQGGKLPLVVAGKDVDRYLCMRGFSTSELEHIHFLGFVPHDDIVYAYNLAEFFVLTTLYESFAFPLVEAMATGCPVIAPTTGACPEVAGDAARLVDPYRSTAIGEAMLSLANSKDERQRLREAGLARSAKFTWEQTARRTLEVFESCLSQR